MTVSWRHRIVRVQSDSAQIAQAVLRAFEDGWIYVAGEASDGEQTDLVFRRARPQTTRRAWA